MIFQYSGFAVSDDGVEFPLFPKNLPPMHGDPDSGVYDIDFAGNTVTTITYTLMDGSGATDLVMPDGRFDRYYINVGFPVGEAMIVSASPDLKVELEVIGIGEMKDDIVDLMGSGLEMPNMPDGGLMLQVGPGTDLTVLGQQILISYTTPVPKMDTTMASVYQFIQGQAKLNDLVAKIKAGEPVGQPDCIGRIPGQNQRSFCNTLPKSFDDNSGIDGMKYILHPMVPPGTTLDFFKTANPPTYEISKFNYLPLYEYNFDADAPYNCDSLTGVRPVQVYGGIGVPKTSQFMLVTDPFVADTNPYYSSSSRRLKKKKGKGSAKGNGSAKAMEPEKNMETIVCGYNFVNQVPFDGVFM